MKEKIELNKKRNNPLFELLDEFNFEKMKRKIDVQERRIKGLQDALSRCVVGSNNSKKIMAKIERAERKIENTKKCLKKCY